jgi:hypothetical protein
MPAKTSHPSAASTHAAHGHQRSHWQDYVPLLVLIGLTLVVTLTKNQLYAPGTRLLRGMHDFMGFFFVNFAMLKLFDLPGFADGFQMYDLLAKPVRRYALAYPFIELALGLGYLTNWRPPVLYVATIVVMGFGALGVIRALARGLDLKCACMGNQLKVPLSTVALAEDLGMAGMAGAMLLLPH